MNDIKNSSGTSVSFFSAISYNRPEPVVGLMALEHLQKWVENLEINGTSFIVFYEMMTGR